MVCHAVMTLKVSKIAKICHMFLFRLLKMKIIYVEKLSSKDSPQDVDEHVDPIDPAVCKDEKHLIHQNSPVQNSVCYNQGKEIDSSVILHNVVVEAHPQVFEVANGRIHIRDGKPSWTGNSSIDGKLV